MALEHIALEHIALEHMALQNSAFEYSGQVEAFFSRLKRFLLAVSWGGHESLVLPFCAFHGLEGKESESTTNWRLVRFYIGWEDADWLIADLEAALEGL